METTNTEHPKKVLVGLNALRESSELTDVVLEVEGRSFPCHRAVLASCSPYFRTMFTSGYAEAEQGRIRIHDVGEVAMATILDYAYTGCFKTQPDQVQAVMSAARLLQVDYICCTAAKYMKDLLDVSNCVDVLMYADMLGDVTLQKASMKFMASRFNQVTQQQSFLQLPLPQVESLLNRDDLMTKSENDVVQAALRWIEFDQKERLKHLPALCRSFRHSILRTRDRLELASKCQSTDSKLVYSSSTTERLGQTHTSMQIFLNKDIFRSEPLQSAPCYDPSRRKMYKMNMPDIDNLYDFSVAVTSDNELYMMGFVGRDVNKNVLFQYNHLLDAWESRCGTTSQRVRCHLVYLKGFIYAIGGECINQVVVSGETAERYDSSCDEWTSIPGIPTPVVVLCAVALDDCIYVISKEGFYCYSATENMWCKKADMLELPVCPQAVAYKGCIYCVHRCASPVCPTDYLWACVVMYDPNTNVWKQCEKNKSFPCRNFTLMHFRGDLYLLTQCTKGDHRDSYDPWDWPRGKRSKIDVYKYGTDCWMKRNGRLVPPMSEWIEARSRANCIVARMIPACLGDGSEYEDMDAGSDEDGESSGYTCSWSGSGLSFHSDSEDYVSDQDNSDDENYEEAKESGSDNGDD